jgi:hypothetical protein
VIARHAGDDAVEPGVTPHADSLGDEDVLRAAERGIAGELAERAFRFVNASENLAFASVVCRRTPRVLTCVSSLFRHSTKP